MSDPSLGSSTSSDIDDQEPTAVGLSNPQLSTGRRRLLDLINRLASTGASVDIDLPQIAVIGSQSAGKSSLIESISGITLPRAAGTCTRCPTECKLSRSVEPWKCTVSLRFITDSSGQVGPVRNEIFGPPIHHKLEVEDRIRRAQRAILNPSKSSALFLSDDDDNFESEISFSTNCVSLQISGPDVADLSFCDLPGLIASVSHGGNETDIALVQDLVISYIAKPSCLILLTVACETDFENQGAHHLAKVYDPDGKRTIGVLTKPDRIPTGEEESWLSFIRNEKEPLKNNWYCVKQPSSSTLKKGISWTEARAQEDQFFSFTSPWSKLDPTYSKYLRTGNLTDRLSMILSDLISQRLPDIQEELESQLDRTQRSLRQLPKAPPQDPLSEVIRLITGFTDDLELHINGVPDDNGLIQTIRPEQETFRRRIRQTAPDFRPYERRFAGDRSLAQPTFLSNEDEEYEESYVVDSENEVTKPIYIDEVMTRAQRARTRELPGNYPAIVQHAYVTAITEQWDFPAKALCRSVNAIVTRQSVAIIKNHFGEFKHGGLESRVRLIMSEHIKQAVQRAEGKIDWLIRVEDRPFTLNNHYLADYKDKFISYYKGSRDMHTNSRLMEAIEKHASSEYTTEEYGITKVMAGLAQVGLHGVNGVDLPKLLPLDPMDPAIGIMANVRAYFQVAYKRFADNVPLAIDRELVLGLKDNLQVALLTGLGINGEDPAGICRELVAEDPRIAQQRDELSKKHERLYAASQELLCLGF